MTVPLPPARAAVTLSFSHDAHAPRRARETVGRLLGEGGEWANDVQLASSELVANVIRHTDNGGVFRAWNSDPFLIEVHDPDPRLPRVMQPHTTGAGGRGLRILDAIADQWGVDATGNGKVVWAAFKRPIR